MLKSRSGEVNSRLSRYSGAHQRLWNIQQQVNSQFWVRLTGARFRAQVLRDVPNMQRSVSTKGCLGKDKWRARDRVMDTQGSLMCTRSEVCSEPTAQTVQAAHDKNRAEHTSITAYEPTLTPVHHQTSWSCGHQTLTMEHWKKWPNVIKPIFFYISAVLNRSGVCFAS